MGIESRGMRGLGNWKVGVGGVWCGSPAVKGVKRADGRFGIRSVSSISGAGPMEMTKAFSMAEGPVASHPLLLKLLRDGYKKIKNTLIATICHGSYYHGKRKKWRV